VWNHVCDKDIRQVSLSEVLQIHIGVSQEFQNRIRGKMLTTPDQHIYPIKPDIFDIKATNPHFIFLSTDACIVPK
jgi:hypothetical protein